MLAQPASRAQFTVMSDAEAELVAFGQVYGPFIIGMMIGCFLFGITMSQAVIYLRRYHKDKPLIRGVVWVSLILDTFHFAMVAEVVHFWYIVCRQPERYLGLLDFHWSLGASVIATYLITSCVQSLYIMRVWMFRPVRIAARSYVLSWDCYSLLKPCPFFSLWLRYVLQRNDSSCTHSDMKVLWGDLTVQHSLGAVHEQVGQIGGSIELAATSLCDIAISVSLWYFLHRNRSGFARTETVVKKLILYTVNIGILTSGASSLTLILWLALPTNFGFISLTLIRSKLYVNSLLVTLNYRNTARDLLNPTGQTQGTTSRFFQDLDLETDIPLQQVIQKSSTSG
ncbi:hypothetical protein DXG01_013568 [Tephrocybe rancida]|nr:hypothetical protein DXG01_013568 [Tephrocybe rancida]